MTEGMSSGFKPEPSAFEVIHGRSCQCGQERATSWPAYSMKNGICTAHYPAECRARDPMVALTPEQHERARRIAAAEGKTVDQVVADAMTIAWVRFAAKNGWHG